MHGRYEPNRPSCIDNSLLQEQRFENFAFQAQFKYKVDEKTRFYVIVEKFAQKLAHELAVIYMIIDRNDNEVNLSLILLLTI